MAFFGYRKLTGRHWSKSAQGRKIPYCCIVLTLIIFLFGCAKTQPETPDAADADAKGNPQTHLKRIEELKKTIKASSVNDENYAQLGNAYFNLREVPRSWKERKTASLLARQMYEKSIELNENNAHAILGLADYYTSGPGSDLEMALKYYNRLIELKPDSSTVYVNLGVCYFKSNKYAEAKKTLKQAVELANQGFAKTFESKHQLDKRKAKEYLGRIYMKEGKLDLAEKVLKESSEGLHDLNVRGDNYWGCPYQAMGRLYSRMGRKEDMAANYIKAAEEQIFTDHSQFEAAYYCFRAGYYYLALNYIDRAIDISNTFYYKPLKLIIWGRLRWAKLTGEEIKSMDAVVDAEGNIDPVGEFHAALESFDNEKFDDAMIRVERALSRDNKSQYKVLKGFLFLFQKRYGEARKLFSESLEENPPNLGAWVGLGHLKIIQKNYASAVMDFQPTLDAGKLMFEDNRSAIDEDQKYDWFCYKMSNLGMGWVYANQKMHDAALKYFDRILALQPGDLLALVGKGNSLVGLQRIDEAETLFENVLRRYPKNAFALAELALVKYNKGEDGKAEEMFTEALAVGDPKYSCPYEGLGLIYLRQGKLGKAKKHFQKAIEIDPNIQYKKFNGLAKIYIQEGKLDDAANLLKRSILNYPQDNEAYALLETTAEALCDEKNPAGVATIIFLARQLADMGKAKKASDIIRNMFATQSVEESWREVVVATATTLSEKGFHDESKVILESIAARD
jgi:tetratricopeptide (TPR) repeat protein